MCLVHSFVTYSMLNCVLSRASEAVAPAIALCSTANDMATWMSAILSTLHHGDKVSVLPQDVLEEVMRPQVGVTDPNMYVSKIQPPRTPATLLYDQYGLAWFVGQYNSEYRPQTVI